MRYVFIGFVGLAMAAVGLTWIAASAQGPKGPAPKASGKPLPTVDSSVTSKTETATFALG